MSSEPTVDRDAEADADDVTPRPLPRKIRQLRWRTWRGILWRSGVGYLEDNCSDYAAAMTYQTVTALIPSLVVVVALINLVTDGSTVLEATVGILRHLGLGSVVDNQALLSVVEALLVRKTPAKVLFGFGLLLALWSASGYVGTFTRASNRIYGVQEGRKWWQMLLLQFALAAVALVLLAAGGTGLVVSGPLVDALGDQLHAGHTVRQLYSTGRWPVLVVIGITLLSLLFWVAPNVRQPRFRWLTVGGVVALTVWAATSFLFGLYVSNFGSYNRTYGSLGAIMAFLAWIYLSNIALLLGVEVNAEVQRGRLIQAGDAHPDTPLAPLAPAGPRPGLASSGVPDLPARVPSASSDRSGGRSGADARSGPDRSAGHLGPDARSGSDRSAGHLGPDARSGPDRSAGHLGPEEKGIHRPVDDPSDKGGARVGEMAQEARAGVDEQPSFSPPFGPPEESPR